MLRCALYGRISSALPDGTEEKTTRQLADSREQAVSRFNWDVVGEYVDSDLSGYDEDVFRPGFEQLLDDAEAGLIDVIVVWKLDRLTRQPKQMERVIDLLESERLLGVYSLMEPMPLGESRTYVIKTLRDMVNYANYESAVKGDRQRRANKARADLGEVGTTGGYRAFGFEVDGVTHRPDEAALIVEAVERVIDGWTSGAIVRDWRKRGVKTPTRERVAVAKQPKRRQVDEGTEWNVSSLRNLLLNPRLAGLRAYRFDRTTGEYDSIVEAVWEPIVDRDRWERCCEKLRANAGVGRRAARTYLLSGFGRCGAPVLDKRGRPVVGKDGEPKLCGAKLVSRPTYVKGEKVPRFVCPPPNDGGHRRGCGRITIRSAALEAEVVGLLLDALSKKRSTRAQEPAELSSGLRAAVLAASGVVAVDADEAVVAELKEIAESLEELDDRHFSLRRSDPDYLPRDRYNRQVAKLKDRRAALTQQVGRTRRRRTLERLVEAERPLEVWEAWSFDEQRAALDEALDYFVVAPAKPLGRKVDPDRIDVRWKL